MSDHNQSTLHAPVSATIEQLTKLSATLAGKSDFLHKVIRNTDDEEELLRLQAAQDELNAECEAIDDFLRDVVRLAWKGHPPSRPRLEDLTERSILIDDEMFDVLEIVRSAEEAGALRDAVTRYGRGARTAVTAIDQMLRAAERVRGDWLDHTERAKARALWREALPAVSAAAAGLKVTIASVTRYVVTWDSAYTTLAERVLLRLKIMLLRSVLVPDEKPRTSELLRIDRQAPPPTDAISSVASLLETMPPANGAQPKATHAADFTEVIWFGARYHFALGQQSRAVEVLCGEWEKGGLGVHESTIANIIGTHAAGKWRLAPVFHGHPAWKSMIAPAEGKGRFKLRSPRKCPE